MQTAQAVPTREDETCDHEPTTDSGQDEPTTAPEKSSGPVVLETRPSGARRRHGIHRRHRHPGATVPVAPQEDDSAQELMLLREENARLKAELHRPPGVGTVIEQVRILASAQGTGEALDEVWALLSECLVIREGLDRVCVELQHAIGDVQQRLAQLAIRVEEVESDSPSASITAHQNGAPDVITSAIAG